MKDLAASRRQPVQFTVRTFFAAAVLVSLFAAAAEIPNEKTRICAISFLAWLTFAGIYHTAAARSLLVTLALAPVATAAGWLLLLLVFALHDELQPWMIVPFAMMWGIELSIFVSMARGLGWLGRRLANRAISGYGPSVASDPPGRFRSPARKLAAEMLSLRLALSGIQTLVAALVPQQPSMWEAALGASFLIDVPLAPCYYTFFPSPPHTAWGMLLATTALGVPLYAGMGWLVGRLEWEGAPPTRSPDGNVARSEGIADPH